MSSSNPDDFFTQVYANLKNALNLPDAKYQDPKQWHISSPQSASEYLGVLTDGRGHVDGFKSYTLEATPTPATIEWHWERVGSTQSGVIFTFAATGYHWHYDSQQNRVVMESTNNDTSFASDPSNIFRFVGADNPYRINPYTASTQYVEYNPYNPTSYLPVIQHQSNYTEFSLETP